MSKLYYPVGVSAGFFDLWVSDGTTLGTSDILKNAQAGDNLSQPSQFIAYGADAIFTAPDSTGFNGVWITNGLAGGTIELLAGVFANSLVDAANFAAAG